MTLRRIEFMSSPAAMNPTVSLNRCDGYEQVRLQKALEDTLSPLGGIASFVRPGQRVLLKPNLLTGARPQGECVTRPEFVAAVARLVMDAGGKPFLSDSPAFGSARGVAIANGYGPYLEELKLPVVEFHGHRFETEHPRFAHLRLGREALDADVVINLPKVKSHVQLTMTLGVKNLFGCCPGKMKAWWHMEAGNDPDAFAEMLVETAEAIAPALTIVDGIIGHEGNGPSNGQPRPLGLIAASAHQHALDRAILEALQIDPKRVPTIRAAERLGYAATEKTLYPLYSPEQLQVCDWKLPERMMAIDFGAPRVIRSTFKHLYIRFIKEPLRAYSQRSA